MDKVFLFFLKPGVTGVSEYMEIPGIPDESRIQRKEQLKECIIVASVARIFIVLWVLGGLGMSISSYHLYILVTLSMDTYISYTFYSGKKSGRMMVVLIGIVLELGILYPYILCADRRYMGILNINGNEIVTSIIIFSMSCIFNAISYTTRFDLSVL